MSEADRIAGVYRDPDRSVSKWDAGNPGNRAIVAERRALTRRVLGERGWLPLSGKRILDVGCGGGGELASMAEYGASTSDLVGVDLLPERVEKAQAAHPDIEFHVANAEQLEFPDASFDLVMAFTLFSSILDAKMSINVAGQIRRVLKSGGGLLWYDFRYDNPSNRNVRGVKAEEIHGLFVDFGGRLHSLTLIPQLARRLGPLTGPAYPALAALPPLRTHLLGLLIKPHAS